MTPPTSRPYAGAADLRRIQTAVARAYRVGTLHVGDVAWLARYHTHRELSLDIRIWENADGQVVGWTYYRAHGGFNIFVAPGCADAALLDELLSVIVAAARASVAAGDPPVSLYTYGVDISRSAEDRAVAAALERHGFTEEPSTGGVLAQSLVDELPPPTVPAGYRLDWVQTRDLTIGRVAAHQAAFAPSDLTLRQYERAQRTWPYRSVLDRIALTEDGLVVAGCTAWLDEQSAAGLLEPVGTHPAHQRRGLASAICLDALRALREAGAQTVQVGFATAAARATYESIGFAWGAADTVYRRSPD